ncbi:MAG: response regulator [Bdellovibrio sp.]|nr:response regulator [Bdellovibrio sp.]
MDLRNKTILVIDDDDDLCLLLQKMLGGSGLHVIRASSATEGLDFLKSHAPHIVLLDLRLGEENGITFLMQKKKLPNPDIIPVIVMSAFNDKKILAVCLSLGAVDFIPKPLSSAKLLIKIKKHLKDSAFPTIDLRSERLQASLECEGDLTHVNEVSCLIRSSIRLKNGSGLKLKAPFLEDYGLDKLNFRTIGQGIYESSGRFNNEVAFLGITETQSRKIRMLATNVKK